MERFTAYKKVTVNNKVELDQMSAIFNKASLTSNPINYQVKAEESYRPDLIAQNYYGDYTYWWAILIFNDILDPFDIIAGQVIALPSMNDIIRIVSSYQKINR